VTEILRTAPGVKILATSRARLNVGGEHRFRVAGMDYPDEETLTQQREAFVPPVPSQVEWAVEGRVLKDVAQYSAVKLFLQGARRAQPSFELTDENLSGVVQVCRLVDGMPLGIRLASAWVEMLTPAEIAAEIGRSFDLLETDRRDVPARQRSIRAAVDHSWKLLTARERAVMQALSVFRGGFTREAAQRVTGVSLHELLALVNRSLLHRTPAGRYEVHELLRQYAEEKLGGSPMSGEAARDHHSAYYTAALQQWGKDLKGARQQAALTQMDAEIENARAAWGWAVEHVPEQVEHLDRSIDGLCTFYQARGRFQEGEAACQKVAARLEDGASVAGLRVRARALAWQGIFAELLGRIELARRLARLALELLSGLQAAGHDTRREEAFALRVKGQAEKALGEPEEAKHGWRESLALCQALGDRWEEANVLECLGWVATHSGLYDEAERLQEKSLDIRRALGDAMGMADALHNLGMLANRTGRLEEAARLVRESIAICRKIGDRVGVATGYHYLSNVYQRKGEYAEAYSLEERALAIHDELGYPHGLIEAHRGMGMAKNDLGEYRDARVHCAVSLAMARETGNQQFIAANLQELGDVRLAEGSYAEAVPLLQESLAIAQESGLRRFETWALLSLGYALRGLGDHRRARHHICAALRIAAEVCTWAVLVPAIPRIALLLADMGEAARAVELYALVLRYPWVANSRWFEDVAGRHIAAIAATLPPEVVAAAQERGRARDLEATVAELLVELEGWKDE
jgi:predicted ATPase